MAATSFAGRCRRRIIQLLLGLAIAGCVAIGGASLVQQLPVMQAQAVRRIAYAATATHLANPVAVTVTGLPTHTPTPHAILPTQEDLQILPTLTSAPAAANSQAGVPAQATSHPLQRQYTLTNFLIVGTDRRGGTSTAYRADVILIGSINQTTQTVSVLSVPRDLYVHIPGWGMDRINTAEVHQAQTRHSSHSLGLLAETVEYNLGLTVDHIVRIDFQGFEALIDHFGGVTVPVDCAVSGYQLQETGLVATNWEPFTLEPGLHLLDGEMALWYVRQRLESSDFDRNRRQQILLRALWQQIRVGDVVSSFPYLWEQITQILDTDLSFDEALGFVPLLLALDSSRVESHFIGLDEVNLWHTPSGSSVLVVDLEPFQTTLTRFLTPPLENRLSQEGARVDVLNASGLPDADHLAAAHLQWQGIVAVPRGETLATTDSSTIIYDHTGRLKGSSLGALQAAFGVEDDAIITVANAEATIDFTVVIGNDFQPCVTSPWVAFAQPP